MSETDVSKNISFNEEKKIVRVVRTITETYDNREIYDVYLKLQKQLTSLEAQKSQISIMMDNIKSDLRELAPIYEKIKKEVENVREEIQH